MSATDIETPVETEADRVVCWRASELLRAGYEADEAMQLAERGDVDLHLALDLVSRGCPPDVAARILL